MGWIIWLSLFGLGSFLVFYCGEIGLIIGGIILLLTISSTPEELNFFKDEEEATLED